MRQYEDPVEVRLATTGAEGATDGSAGVDSSPEQFLWRGRLWKVRAVLARWVETPAWWVEEKQADEPPGEASRGVVGLPDRECWRVEAGTRAGSGIFDLAMDRSDGRWQLVGCAD